MAEYNPSKIIKDGNTYNFRDTTKIPLVGSNEISGSLVPSTDGTVNLGSSTAQWNNAYIKSLTINGTQFLPSDYATLSGLSTVATSGSYNDLSNKPTIPTVNNGTLTIQQNGTTVDTFTANSSSDKTVNISVPTKTSDLNNDSGFIISEIDSSGTGWVRFKSGLQICWVQARLSNSVYNWNFPKTFLKNPGVTATIFYEGSNVNTYQRSIEINLITSTGVSLRSANHQFGSNTYIAGSDNFNAIAIGMWK